MSNGNLWNALGEGLMGFTQNLVQGQQAAQQGAMRQAQLQHMQKADWQQSYDKGMDELANDALMRMATGSPIDGVDPSVLRRVDPTKLFALKQIADDQAWKASMGMGGRSPVSMPQQAEQQGPMTQGGAGPAAPQGQVKDLIDYWSRYHGANPADVYPVAKVESNYQQTDPRTGRTLTSPAGALGVMQLMPDTAQGLGVNPEDVSDNINGGVKYLKQQMDRYGDPYLAYRAYNGGPGNVESNATVPYANKVFGLRQQAQGQQPQLGPQVALAGPQTMTDASGQPPMPGQQYPQYGGQGGDRLGQIMKMPPEEFVKVLMSAPKDKQAVLESLYKQANPEAPTGLREFQAIYGRPPISAEEYRQFKKGESPGGSAFEGSGMEQQSWSVVNSIGPKIQEGTATPEEQRRYLSAEAHLTTPKVSIDPATGAQTVMQLDLSQFGFPSLRKRVQNQQPSQIGRQLSPQDGGQQQPQTGYTTTQNGGGRPLSANDAGKVQGANLSLDYLNQVEKKLFPNGTYDREAVAKSYLPGTEEGDIRNKVRESIGYALYLKTGAAATPKEIAEQESLYMPGIADTATVAKSKLDRLKSFLSAVVQGTGREISFPGTPDPQADPNLKNKYGLE